MLRTPLALAAALHLACTVTPSGETATDGTGTTATTTGTTATATGTTTTATTGPEPLTSDTLTDPQPPTTSGTTAEPLTTGDTTTTTTTGVPVDEPCDQWLEDCPPGHKCMPVSLDGDQSWETLRCVPIAPNPAGVGEPCELLGTGVDGLDTCDLHGMCWDVDPDTGQGTCLGMCTGTVDMPGCVDPDAVCQLFNEGVVTLCFPTCDPVAQDCPPGDMCIPAQASDSFLCAPAAGGAGQVFEPCEHIAACDPGLVCVGSKLAPDCDAMQPACCLPFCDLTQPNTCPGMGLDCQPWFPEGEAPPGLENIGLCSVMP